MTFKALATAATALCAILAAVLLIAPNLIYSIFQIPAQDSADFMSRRAAMLFLGIAVMCSTFRLVQDPAAIRAFSAGMVIMMAGLAGVGLFEFARGFAGPGIFLAIVTEILFVLGFTRFVKQTPAAPNNPEQS